VGGVAGAYQQVDGDQAAHVMSAELAHRGPDGQGFYSFVTESVSAHIAHLRLSLDGSAGATQPLVKHKLAISYDGQLYNHRELRSELAAHGATFASSCDAEVVLEAWGRWGPGCLRKFRGMFALAVFDERKGSLFLARDHLGIKPLHYLRRKDGVVFASELKAIVAAFGHELEIEPSALIASLLYFWVPDQRCSLNGVEKLQPGTCAEFRPDGSYSVKVYFDVAEVAAAAAAGPPIDIREAIEASVAAHVVADVPVSCFLSGGLDSGIVTVLAKRANPQLGAFTATFRPHDQRLEAMRNEAGQARKLARRYGISLHEVRIEPDVAELLPRLVKILDEPIGDPAAVSTLLMCEAARDAGVKVILSGLGADELFAGHRRHVACVMAQRYCRLPERSRHAAGAIVKRLPASAAGRKLRYAGWAKRFLTFAELPEEAAFRRSYSLFDAAELAALLSPELAPDVSDIMGEHFEVYSDNCLSDHVNRMCLADARLFLPSLHLSYTDRASMAASTEVRHPFVDPLVFRAAFSVPGDRKLSGRTGKVVLKEAARAWLPGKVIDRPKAAFSAPLRTWVARDLREVIDDLLLKGDLAGTGFIRPEAVQALVDENRAGRQDRSKQIWQLLTLELWYRQASRAGVGL
jgi:asparagine synthase (glutamine-hydrolysing)